MIRAILEFVGYQIRPYDMLADQRRWFWQPATRCWTFNAVQAAWANVETAALGGGPEPCWDCIKGRHQICEGGDCGCPVLPARTPCRRQPVFSDGVYTDPGEEACARGEADCSLTCEVHDGDW